MDSAWLGGKPGQEMEGRGETPGAALWDGCWSDMAFPRRGSKFPLEVSEALVIWKHQTEILETGLWLQGRPIKANPCNDFYFSQGGKWWERNDWTKLEATRGIRESILCLGPSTPEGLKIQTHIGWTTYKNRTLTHNPPQQPLTYNDQPRSQPDCRL